VGTSLLIAALRSVTSLPLHTVCAMLTAMNVITDGLIGTHPVREVIVWFLDCCRPDSSFMFFHLIRTFCAGCIPCERLW
jgi:hypothetical protein